MTLRRGVTVAALLGVLGAVLALMVADATTGHDWPGWDEGWAIVAFPLGVPVAVAAGLVLAHAGRPQTAFLASVALVTLAVWCWGATLFVGWLAAG